MFANMASNITNTYDKAKELFNYAELKQDCFIDVHPDNVATLRKHLSEMIKRKESGKRFTSRLLDNNQLLVVRIK